MCEVRGLNNTWYLSASYRQATIILRTCPHKINAYIYHVQVSTSSNRVRSVQST